MLLPNSNVVKREGESKQQCFYLTAMLLKGKRSSNSNVVTLQQCCYFTAMLLPNSNVVTQQQCCKKGRGVLTAKLIPNSNVVKREEKF
jgi:hypothetical protein